MSVAAEQIERAGDNRPPAYWEGSTLIIRASSLGRSSHALAAAIAGVKPVELTNVKTLQYMSEGNLHEADICERVAKETEMAYTPGLTTPEQEEIDFQLFPNVIIRVHPDGFLWMDDLEPAYVVEAKAMSKDVFARWSAVEFDYSYPYAVQFSVEMLATGLPGVFAYKNRNDGEVKHKAYLAPPVSLADIRKRVLTIRKHALDGNLNPYPDEKCRDYPCSYHFLHTTPEAESEHEVDLDDVLDGLAEMVDSARSRRKQAEKMEKDAADKLKLALADREAVQTLRYKVSLTPQTRTAIDRKKLEAAGINVEKFETTTHFSRLLVNPLNKDGGK